MLGLCACADSYDNCVFTGVGLHSRQTRPGRMAPYHDALVHVAVVVLYTDADDAGVFVLLIVNRRQHCGGNGRHGDGALVHFRVVVAGWRRGQRVDEGRHP